MALYNSSFVGLCDPQRPSEAAAFTLWISFAAIDNVLPAVSKPNKLDNDG